MGTGDRARRTRGRTYLRVAVWVLVAASWLVMLVQAWSAFATVPTAERLAESRLTRIPTLGSLGVLVVRSGAELGAVLGLLWPWWRRWYGLRLGAVAVALPAWFVATTPLALTRMDWVHRRWLAAVWLVVVLALVMALAAGVWRGLRRPAHTETDDAPAA